MEEKKLVYYDTSAKTGLNVRDMFIWVATELSERSQANTSTTSRPKGTSL